MSQLPRAQRLADLRCTDPGQVAVIHHQVSARYRRQLRGKVGVAIGGSDLGMALAQQGEPILAVQQVLVMGLAVKQFQGSAPAYVAAASAADTQVNVY